MQQFQELFNGYFDKGSTSQDIIKSEPAFSFLWQQSGTQLNFIIIRLIRGPGKYPHNNIFKSTSRISAHGKLLLFKVNYLASYPQKTWNLIKKLGLFVLPITVLYHRPSLQHVLLFKIRSLKLCQRHSTSCCSYWAFSILRAIPRVHQIHSILNA